ncbi:MAG: hypothetical protein JO257_22785 [Deltaproteobacteria bacterium]|nr:hypothetical protein [Deltaproteobacteria bacterium]
MPIVVEDRSWPSEVEVEEDPELIEGLPLEASDELAQLIVHARHVIMSDYGRYGGHSEWVIQRQTISELSSDMANAVEQIDQLALGQRDLELRLDRLERQVDAGHARKPDLGAIELVARTVSCLQRAYELTDAGAVAAKLFEKADVVRVLCDAGAELTRRDFVAGEPKLSCDADGDLLIEVPTKLAPAEAEPAFSKFLREWWMVRTRGVVRGVTLTLDYSPTCGTGAGTSE